jgi:hypothetical protein
VVSQEGLSTMESARLFGWLCLATAFEGNEAAQRNLRQETVTNVYEYWTEFAGCVMRAVNPHNVSSICTREELMFI